MADPAVDHGGAAASGRCGRHADVRAARCPACRHDGSGLPAASCPAIRRPGRRWHARRKYKPCQAPRVRRLFELLPGRTDAALPRPSCRGLHRRATSRHRNGHLADGIHSRRPAPAPAAAFCLTTKQATRVATIDPLRLKATHDPTFPIARRLRRHAGPAHLRHGSPARH